MSNVSPKVAPEIRCSKILADGRLDIILWEFLERKSPAVA
jgi:hypothetical protein